MRSQGPTFLCWCNNIDICIVFTLQLFAQFQDSKIESCVIVNKFLEVLFFAWAQMKVEYVILSFWKFSSMCQVTVCNEARSLDCLVALDSKSNSALRN